MKKQLLKSGKNTFTCSDSGYGTAMIPLSVDGVPLIGFDIGSRVIFI